MSNDLGLTEEESRAMDGLIAAAEHFAGLEQTHPSDLDEFIDAIHRAQAILALRVVRRDHPEGWLTRLPKGHDPRYR